ncbi:flagellar basal body-associated FliL family protein [Actibacterium lipolyticum]|uniref:Flagellar protein FliL n=1 Tax=Actibacterium lipolyticum TaxID=1524263 RepID=A0A238KYY6_9RHOB|nr:flagellar basal body-associated FliL family protein [Actibacterium lipolyticum]SMX47412.1 Flagellar basal body-associated protein FliL [Actibacterium lipolyticum]
MANLVPVLLGVVGLALGAGAGHMMKPTVVDEAKEEATDTTQEKKPAKKDDENEAAEFVKLNNQFIVPVVENGRVAALVVISLSLEVTYGARAAVYEREPKIRDAFLRVLFDHANAGGFMGTFTNTTTMDSLRIALRETAQKVLGPDVTDVLIIDLVRQDT